MTLEHITSGNLDIQTEARLGDLTDELENYCTSDTTFCCCHGNKGTFRCRESFVRKQCIISYQTSYLAGNMCTDR